MLILRVVLVVVIPALVASTVLAVIPALRRLSWFARLGARSKVWLLLRVIAFVALLLYLAVMAAGPARSWAWYSSAIPVPKRDIMIAVSQVAITAWAGCLIAFSVLQRLTPDLSRGLRFMLYACFTPLIALTGSGLVIRTAALAAAAYWGTWALFQFRRPSRKKFRLTLTLNPEGDPGPPDEELGKRVRYLNSFLLDRLAEYLTGWAWSALLSALATLVLLVGTESAVLGCSLLALISGLFLAFSALVLPDTHGSGVIL